MKTLPPIVLSMIQNYQESVNDLRKRITNVKHLPYFEGQTFECIRFDLDGKLWHGILKGRNKDFCLGFGKDQDAAIALRCLLDEDARPSE